MSCNDESPPSSVYFSHDDPNLDEDVDDYSELTGSSCGEDLALTHGDCGFAPDDLEGPEERDYLESAQPQEIILSMLRQCEVESVALQTVLRRERPRARRGRCPDRSVHARSTTLLVDVNAKLARDNARRRAPGIVARTALGERRDRHERLLVTLRHCNNLLRQRRSLAELTPDLMPKPMAELSAELTANSSSSDEDSGGTSLHRSSREGTLRDNLTPAEEEESAAREKPMDFVWIQEPDPTSTDGTALCGPRRTSLLPCGDTDA